MNNSINKENAIELSSFILIFERSFSKNELQSLRQLKSKFKEDLPVFNEINSVNVSIEGHNIKNSNETIGFLLQSFKDNSKPSWILKIEENIIEVTCFSYDNWDAVWGKVNNYFLETLLALESDNNKLVICVLKVVDKFFNTSDNYNIKDIFNLKTPYLTQNVLNGQSGDLWHVYEGWFDELKNKTYLNALNLSTINESGSIITNIEHTVQCQFIKCPQIISEFKEVLMGEVFSSLHTKNKEALQQLLNQEQLERIGLCKI